MVERTLVRPPNSRVGPITEAERKAVINASPVRGEYEETLERDSAHEMLQKRTQEREAAQAESAEDKAAAKKSAGASRSDSFWTTLGKTIIRTGVPLATKVLTDALKGRTRRGGGGFTGYGLTSDADQDGKPDKPKD